MGQYHGGNSIVRKNKNESMNEYLQVMILFPFKRCSAMNTRIKEKNGQRLLTCLFVEAMTL